MSMTIFGIYKIYRYTINQVKQISFNKLGFAQSFRSEDKLSLSLSLSLSISHTHTETEKENIDRPTDRQTDQQREPEEQRGF